MEYPVSISRQLREHLRGMRMQKGMTQGELGKLMGLGQARIAEIESKPGAISVDQLLQILSTLGGGMLVDDGNGPPESLVHAPASEKRATQTTRSRSAGSGEYREPKLSPGSKRISRVDKTLGTKRDLDKRQDAQPDPAVTPTRRRHFIIRPKKGSW